MCVRCEVYVLEILFLPCVRAGARDNRKSDDDWLGLMNSMVRSEGKLGGCLVCYAVSMF